MDNYIAYSPVPEQLPAPHVTYHDFLVEHLNALYHACPKGQSIAAIEKWGDECALLIKELKVYGKRTDQYRAAAMYLAEAMVGRNFNDIRMLAAELERMAA